jgi:DNA uptake protein ComE-like DNA-binding protein
MKTIPGILRFALAALAMALIAAPRAEAASKKVDLNSATAAELEALPGVGAATARKIIAGRPYSSVADLSRAGVSSATIDKISSLVTAKGSTKAPRSEKAARNEEPEKKPKAEKSSARSSSATSTRSEKTASGSSSTKVDLNTASAKELEDLPGVGEATAKKIIAGRPYSSVEDLSRAGVSASTIQKISPLVVAGGHRRVSHDRAPAPASSSAPPPPPPATGASSSSAASSSRATNTSASSGGEVEQPFQAPPRAGMVWVNTATKVYHYEGDRWYGRTKEGKYMSEKDAIAAGYRASKQKSEAEKQ